MTRPINSQLMFSFEEFEQSIKEFSFLIKNIRERNINSIENGNIINKFIYTAQQSIGSTLDALPPGQSNTARKINGDLFERFIRIIIENINIPVREGAVSIPVTIDNEVAFKVGYQHDLIIGKNENINAIGSIKTSSKDRIDKIFMDKFLHNKLTEKKTPHFAIFLNDVQRKGKEGKYSIGTTFLTGHFKGYTIKLNPLDGVYYCDIRPNMVTEDILKNHIKTFDHFLITDVWKFV